MIGQDAIGFHAVGEAINNVGAPVTFEPVSKVEAGSGSTPRTAEAAVLGWDLLWDSEDYITWDDGTSIGGE